MYYLKKFQEVIIIITLTVFLNLHGEEKLTTEDGINHRESAEQYQGTNVPDIQTSSLPEGMTLDQVLDRAAKKPPADYTPAMNPNMLFNVTMINQLEYRFTDDSKKNHLGWDAQGWIGYDFDKFWWKTEGESVLESHNEGESANDFLYSRLISPFWDFQIGVQYANEWVEDDYNDRWSGVIALQGLLPYKFEFDSSLYISEHADLTLEIEAEYDLRITQRTVLQPRAAVKLSAQDIPERNLGSGVTGVDLDLRLRYELKRELAPYIGIRFSSLTGETASIAKASGEDPNQFYLLLGFRLIF
jgi:copper resistance protein B